MKTARQIAFEALFRVHKDNAYSNLVLDKQLQQSGLPSREISFASAIFYGVLERMITLDYIISNYLKQPIKKLKPEVLILLRIGVYQLLYMDKIPDSAAINETVNQAKAIKKIAFASGLINGVLRNVQRGGVILPKDENSTEFLQVKYSSPKWLIELFVDTYGKENAVAILENCFGRPPMTVKVNNLKITKDELIKKFKDEGVTVLDLENDDYIMIADTGSVEKLSSYQEGLFHVQDLASQYCCKALGAKENETVIDVCSAPGGKTFTVAQGMNNTGKVLAMDLYSLRTLLVIKGATRLGIENIDTKVNDATKYNEKLGVFDKVLCDVVCSGLGIIRRKPEIRFKSPDEINELPKIQYDILKTSSQYVKEGGRLIYSTCSLNPKENEEVAKKFLEENDNFKSVKVLPELKRFSEDTDYITLLPNLHSTDGFFIAGFERVR